MKIFLLEMEKYIIIVQGYVFIIVKDVNLIILQ